MTRTIIIETQSDADFALLQELAHRMGLNTLDVKQNGQGELTSSQLLEQVAGSWQGDETGDEINAMLRNDRWDKSREIDL
ncbi:hypothetical protein [Spirosoma rhododendri]|uniref:Uncharacterized protein n=1 Tax=Spirosoma rhododendri TaxID=2728024 RepID=A0A7L5DNL7_9BACT|nr:hypothetical protein [Spirosoma rhododendri]QJD80059.1 hypothetical protein HH216_17795 [Spirosoma rhododendri]